MAKKIDIEVEKVEEVAAPTPLAFDFGREDLNALQAAVNFLLAKGE